MTNTKPPTHWQELAAGEPLTFEEALEAAWRRKELNYTIMASVAIGFGLLMAAIFALAIVLTVRHG